MIFPSLKGKTFKQVNLDTEAQNWCALEGVSVTKESNPLLDPKICQRMVDDMHKKYSVDFSYGSYLEDRSFLWKGSYLEEEGTFIHLGVDLNVPSGTEVAADFKATVTDIDDDYPEEGGWGTRVIVKHADAPIHMIYAHLDRDLKCKVGDVLEKGDVFAKVGKAPYNGNWFSHCHVQTVDSDYYEQLKKGGDFGDLDGYGSASDMSLNIKRFKDPMDFISLK